MKKFLFQSLDNYFVKQTPSNAYYSEKAVQLKIGIELYKLCGLCPKLEHKFLGQKAYLDIFVECGGKKYAIELKCKTIAVANSAYHYSTHGAQNNGRYDYFRDISRLENWQKNGFIDHGFAIFLTNDNSYCTPCTPSTAVANFDISHRKHISANTYTPSWKGRSKPIILLNCYTCNWSPPPNPIVQPGDFRYCIIDV